MHRRALLDETLWVAFECNLSVQLWTWARTIAYRKLNSFQGITIWSTRGSADSDLPLFKVKATELCLHKNFNLAPSSSSPSRTIWIIPVDSRATETVRILHTDSVRWMLNAVTVTSSMVSSSHARTTTTLNSRICDLFLLLGYLPSYCGLASLSLGTVQITRMHESAVNIPEFIHTGLWRPSW